MEKILIVNLTDGHVETRPYSYEEYGTYGRGLALQLVREFVPEGEPRFGENNALVFVPGLFAGCQAPSACRLMIASAAGMRNGMQLCNTTGNMPQKLGSLGIAALVIHGRSETKERIVRITETGAELTRDSRLTQKKSTEIVNMLKETYGQDCSIVGVGKTADMRLSLATFFCTYPNGNPEYHCPRNGFGDIFGAKNLRAVVVESDCYFSRECKEKEIFRETGRKLAQRIVSDDVCGGALPAYGSITLLKILKDKKSIEHLKHRECTGKSGNTRTDENGKKSKTNYCCAPMCVVGCLNRHTSYEGDAFSSPAQSEVLAALQNCFGWNDPALACKIQDSANEIGIVGTEFVTAAKVYAQAQGITPEPDRLLEWMDEIERGSLIGRVIASRTYGIAELYPEKEELKPLLDRKAIMDESLFDVKLSNPYTSLSGLKDVELLYAKIFVLENLGFCIFTSFALLDNADTFEDMAHMFTAKTGADMDGETLIRQAHAYIQAEQQYEVDNWHAGLRSNIPPFTKVLYRYFGQKEGV